MLQSRLKGKYMSTEVTSAHMPCACAPACKLQHTESTKCSRDSPTMCPAWNGRTRQNAVMKWLDTARMAGQGRMTGRGKMQPRLPNHMSSLEWQRHCYHCGSNMGASAEPIWHAPAPFTLLHPFLLSRRVSVRAVEALPHLQYVQQCAPAGCGQHARMNPA